MVALGESHLHSTFILRQASQALRFFAGVGAPLVVIPLELLAPPLVGADADECGDGSELGEPPS